MVWSIVLQVKREMEMPGFDCVMLITHNVSLVINFTE